MTQYLRVEEEVLDRNWNLLMRYLFESLENSTTKVEAQANGVIWIRKRKYLFVLGVWTYHLVDDSYLQLKLADGVGTELMTMRMPSSLSLKRLDRVKKLVRGRMDLYMG